MIIEAQSTIGIYFNNENDHKSECKLHLQIIKKLICKMVKINLNLHFVTSQLRRNNIQPPGNKLGYIKHIVQYIKKIWF